MKLRCLLVDDEPPALDVLETYVRAVESLELVGRCESALQAFQVLQQQPVDVLFLDIQMPQLLGTDFVRSLRQPPAIIFTTAYRDYALDGFELGAADYLLKPIPFERFLRAIGKIAAPPGVPALPAPGPGPVPATALLPATEPFVYVRTDRKTVKVLLRDIAYVESLKDYVKIFLVTAPPLLVKQSLSSLAEMLPATRFVRIHRSFLVALAQVMSYTAQHVEVAGQELPVGGLFQKDVLRALQLPTS